MKPHLLALAALAALTSLLAACGGDDEAPAATPTPTPISTATVRPGGESTTPPQPTGPITTNVVRLGNLDAPAAEWTVLARDFQQYGEPPQNGACVTYAFSNARYRLCRPSVSAPNPDGSNTPPPEIAATFRCFSDATIGQPLPPTCRDLLPR